MGHISVHSKIQVEMVSQELDIRVRVSPVTKIWGRSGHRQYLLERAWNTQRASAEGQEEWSRPGGLSAGRDQEYEKDPAQET